MPLEPIDAGEVPEEEIKALEEHKPVTPETGSEPSQQTPEAKVEKLEAKPEEPKVPFHEDPAVQLYIERQVAKRVGEGNQALLDRLNKLEDSITKPKETGSIGGWTPGSPAEARAARAIILQAKRELMEDLSSVDRETREAEAKNDRDFSDFLGDLRTTGVLKNDEDEMEFARLIVEYQLEDKNAAVKLWNTLQGKIAEEKDKEEEEKGKGAAKVGSARKGGEPGTTGRTYQQRRLEEPNFDAIVDREMSRMGY